MIPGFDVRLDLPVPFVEVPPEQVDPYAALLGDSGGGSLLLLAAAALPEDPQEPGAGLLLALQPLPLADPDVSAEGTLLVLQEATSARGSVRRVDLPAGPAVQLEDLVEVDVPFADLRRTLLLGKHQLWLPLSGLGLLTLTVTTARVDEHEAYTELVLLLGERLSCTIST